MNIYEKIVDCFELTEGDNVWISSELIKLVLILQDKNITFEGNELINAFQKKIGVTGTILIPTFSFEFSNKGFYDIKKTIGVTGALGNIALKRDDFNRTNHPMHSFAVWGNDQKILTSMMNKNSFGFDSPFGYCIKKKVKQIIIGADYNRAFTFIHYAEVSCNVPYRYQKSFTGEYVNKNGSTELRTYDYMVRNLDISPTEQFNRIGKVLEKECISKKINVLGIDCYLLDLAKSFPIICKDIIENKCANLYDFNISRNIIFM